MPPLEAEALTLFAELEQTVGRLLAGTPDDDYRMRNRLIYLLARTRRARQALAPHWDYLEEADTRACAAAQDAPNSEAL